MNRRSSNEVHVHTTTHVLCRSDERTPLQSSHIKFGQFSVILQTLLYMEKAAVCILHMFGLSNKRTVPKLYANLHFVSLNTFFHKPYYKGQIWGDVFPMFVLRASGHRAETGLGTGNGNLFKRLQHKRSLGFKISKQADYGLPFMGLQMKSY